MDSSVAKGALAKGRSAARGLKAVCKRSAALQVSFGFSLGWNFAPACLNVADDPTRRQALRATASLSLAEHLSLPEAQALHGLKVSRWASNWLRLVILISVMTQCKAGDPCVSLGLLDFARTPWSLLGAPSLDYTWTPIGVLLFPRLGFGHF